MPDNKEVTVAPEYKTHLGINPLFLTYIATLNGHNIKEISEGFRYCCITTEDDTSIIPLASLFPKATFFLVLPDHKSVEKISSIATTANLTNISFHKLETKLLRSSNFNNFDFIVVNENLSYMDRKTLDLTISIFEKLLNLQGIVHVKYDCLPGCAPILDLRQVLVQLDEVLNIDSHGKVLAGLDHIKHLKSKGAPYFLENGPVEKCLSGLAQKVTPVTAKILFGSIYKPRFFNDINNRLNKVGMVYSGSSIAYRNYPELVLNQEFNDQISNSTSRENTETLLDFVTRQDFRADIFVKDTRTFTATEKLDALSSIPFGTLVGLGDFPSDISFGQVNINYKSEVINTIIEELTNNAKTVKNLSSLLSLSAHSKEVILENVNLLVASGYVLPLKREISPDNRKFMEANRFQLCSSFNQEILKNGLFSEPFIYLAAEEFGIQFEISRDNAILLVCLLEAPQEHLLNWIAQRLSEQNPELLPDPAAIEKKLANFRQIKLPKLVEFGIIKPETV